MDASRRRLVAAGAAVVASLGLDTFRRAFEAAPSMTGPYGLLSLPDAHGVRLPAGFNARLLARTGDLIAGRNQGEPWRDSV